MGWCSSTRASAAATSRDPRRLGGPSRLLLNPRLAPEQTAVAQVRALGHDPADVRHILVTHLDLDHAGGLGDFPDAEVHVHATELDIARRRPADVRLRYRPAQWAHGPRWVEHAADGDSWFGFERVRVLGSTGAEVAMIPLHGHTAGHAGYAIRERRGLAAALRRRLPPPRRGRLPAGRRPGGAPTTASTRTTPARGRPTPTASPSSRATTATRSRCSALTTRSNSARVARELRTGHRLSPMGDLDLGRWATEAIDAIGDLYGRHGGERATHAKGTLCAATSRRRAPPPSSAAPAISRVRQSTHGSGSPTAADSPRARTARSTGAGWR